MNDIETALCDVLKQYPVKRAALFGSAARVEMSGQSDIDMLVEFLPCTRGLEFFGLRVDLEESLGRSVDLLTWGALQKAKPSFKRNVENDARVIYEL